MMRFIVEGGTPLKGSVNISGSKNAALKMIAASLLTAEEVVLENVPNISDIQVLIDVIKTLGCEAVWIDNNKLRLKSPTPVSERVPEEITRTTRSAVMLMAPLLVRFGRFSICSPGGDAIGLRPINRHLTALRAFGAKIKLENGCYQGSAKLGLTGTEVSFNKITVMGTETAILAAVLAKGKSSINNAAAEPEVDDLIEFLNKMGAKVQRRLERTIEIEGVNVLHGASHEIIPDRNEVVTFALCAAVTRGDININRIITGHLTSMLAKLEKIGVSFVSTKESLRVWVEAEKVLNPIDLETTPHPGFMTDWQQPFTTLLTQAEGVSHVHETIYLNRFEYVRELNRMGAKIEILKPSQRGFKAQTDEEYDLGVRSEPETLAEITGPTPLNGRRLSIPDLRAGATLVLAALSASGKSEILGVEHVDRGYEDFDGKLRHLGAKIERLAS